MADQAGGLSESPAGKERPDQAGGRAARTRPELQTDGVTLREAPPYPRLPAPLGEQSGRLRVARRRTRAADDEPVRVGPGERASRASFP